MNEEWKDIEGYEGIYQVSNKGRVKVLPHIVHRGFCTCTCPVNMFLFLTFFRAFKQ